MGLDTVIYGAGIAKQKSSSWEALGRKTYDLWVRHYGRWDSSGILESNTGSLVPSHEALRELRWMKSLLLAALEAPPSMVIALRRIPLVEPLVPCSLLYCLCCSVT